MNPWQTNILDAASNLADPPKSGTASAWIFGIGAALLLVACGTYWSFTSHAWILNVGFRGFPRDQPGLFREVFGRQATALGVVLIGMGLFANIHWFWPRFEPLSRYAALAKATCLVLLIAAASWWIYESI